MEKPRIIKTKMIIVIRDRNFEMVQTSGPFFDLSVLSKINEGTEKEREEMKLIAHGLPFDACLKEVAHWHIDKTKTYNILGYVTAYKKAVEEISTLIGEEEKPKRSRSTSKEDSDEY